MSDQKSSDAPSYTYADAGVSIDAGNALVRAIAPLFNDFDNFGFDDFSEESSLDTMAEDDFGSDIALPNGAALAVV